MAVIFTASPNKFQKPKTEKLAKTILASFLCYNKLMLKRASHRSKRGDTLIEVMFAVAVFGMVSVGAIGVMNRGLYGAQESLEVTMARSEIDTQAEALRFVHESFVSNPKDQNNPYAVLWNKIIDKAYYPNTGDSGENNLPSNFFSSYSDEENYANRSCAAIYNRENQSLLGKSFVINPRILGTKDLRDAEAGLNGLSLADVLVTGESKLIETPTYPRLLYSKDGVTADDQSLSDVDTTGGGVSSINRLYENSKFDSAQGIWVTAVASGTGTACDINDYTYEPDYYDFYIRTCWNAPDGKEISNTISSTIRLYNPNQSKLDYSSATAEISAKQKLIFMIDESPSMQSFINEFKSTAERLASEALDNGAEIALYSFVGCDSSDRTGDGYRGTCGGIGNSLDGTGHTAGNGLTITEVCSLNDSNKCTTKEQLINAINKIGNGSTTSKGGTGIAIETGNPAAENRAECRSVFSSGDPNAIQICPGSEDPFTNALTVIRNNEGQFETTKNIVVILTDAGPDEQYGRIGVGRELYDNYIKNNMFSFVIVTNDKSAPTYSSQNTSASWINDSFPYDSSHGFSVYNRSNAQVQAAAQMVINTISTSSRSCRSETL